MVICFPDGHCYEVIIIDLWPKKPHGPGNNYPRLFHDASLVASLEAMSQNAEDDGVRDALQRGVDAAVEALQSRAADGIEVRR